MNVRFATWVPESPPADWTRVRDQWEYSHAARFVLQLVGLGALVLSALADGSSKHRLERLGRQLRLR
jgi:hypothetical protein